MYRFALTLLAFLVLACAAPVSSDSFDAVAATAPIVNGDAGGLEAVVVLQNYRSGGLCTGSLIAERVVLTAKHCVQEAFAEGPVNPNEMVVGVGDSTRSVTRALRVLSIDTTDGVYTEGPQGSIRDDLIGVDVAVMILETGVPGLVPLPLMRESHTTLGGQTITAVGYGQTPSGQVGVKYTTMGRVLGTSDELIYVGAITCQGDSGGPAITAAGEVAGVVSFGSGGCGTGSGAYNAISPFFELIDAALTAAGSCLNDGEERCDGADNDCDDLVDETCTAIGGACEASVECVGRRCEETVAGQICTVVCDPLRPDFGCDPGLYCAFAEGCSGFCVPIGAGDQGGAIGEDCEADGECDSFYCADPGDGRRRCLSACRGDAGMCLAGEACAATPGACGGCVASAILVGDRGLGEECDVAGECRSGNCLEDVGRSYCSRDCAMDADCPANFHCREAVCVSGPRGDIGEPCTGNGDCVEGAFCAMRGAEAWCTRQCTVEPCPDGFACVAAGGTMVCAPELGLVGEACVTGAECLNGICEDGSCSRMCSADAACAPGFECRRAGADGETALCLAPAVEVDGGGCAAAPRGEGGGGLPLATLGLIAVVGLRRRRPCVS